MDFLRRASRASHPKEPSWMRDPSSYKQRTRTTEVSLWPFSLKTKILLGYAALLVLSSLLVRITISNTLYQWHFAMLLLSPIVVYILYGPSLKPVCGIRSAPLLRIGSVCLLLMILLLLNFAWVTYWSIQTDGECGSDCAHRQLVWKFTSTLGIECTRYTAKCQYDILAEDSPQCCRRHMLEMLSCAKEFFGHYNISWWLNQGTLIGALREGGIIPWDNDIDIGIYAEPEKIEQIVQDRQATGSLRCMDRYYYVRGGSRTPELLLPHRMESRAVTYSEINKLRMDIQLWRKAESVRAGGQAVLRREGVEVPVEYMLPTRPCLFEDEECPCPRDPLVFLYHYYGQETDFINPVYDIRHPNRDVAKDKERIRRKVKEVEERGYPSLASQLDKLTG